MIFRSDKRGKSKNIYIKICYSVRVDLYNNFRCQNLSDVTLANLLVESDIKRLV